MSNTAIRVENLGKSYIIGHEKSERYTALRDVISNKAKQLLRNSRQMLNGGQLIAGTELEEFWALKELNFEIKQGESIGILGRNGAGKSTLLKILSRITEPTTGRVMINGRVASLLEVGTGFHPELTGRENIYLNGAILGMARKEIKQKFDEIVDFSGVEKFLDTPVKRYSSGMYVRLAFAVAAHLESEIMVVDEVLAVGDAEFQKKCLGKMGDVSNESGRTILFVSHNTQAIQRLCKRVIVLDKGELMLIDNAQSAIDFYLNSGLATSSELAWEKERAPGDEIVRLKSVKICNTNGEAVNSIEIRQPLCFEVEYWQLKNGMKPSVGIHLYNTEGICLFATYDFNNLQWFNQSRAPGLIKSRCSIPGNFLAEGRYFIEIYIISHTPAEIHHVLERNLGLSFEVIDQSEGDGVRGPVNMGWIGVMRPMLIWDIHSTPL